MYTKASDYDSRKQPSPPNQKGDRENHQKIIDREPIIVRMIRCFLDLKSLAKIWHTVTYFWIKKIIFLNAQPESTASVSSLTSTISLPRKRAFLEYL